MKKIILPFILAGALFILAILLMIPPTNKAIYALFGIDTSGKTTITSDFDAFAPFIPGYFPDGFEIKYVGSGGESAPDYDIYTEFYASDSHFFKLIESQGSVATPFVANLDRTVQGRPVELIADPDAVALISGDIDILKYDLNQLWHLSIFLKDIKVEIVSNLPPEEVLLLAENLIPSFCTSTPTPPAE